MKERSKKREKVKMTTQQFNKLRKKINELIAAQLKSLQGDIRHSLHKKRKLFTIK